MSALTSAKRAFYNADGPWRRRGLFEALGSRRYSRPALHEMDTRLESLVEHGDGVFLEAGAHDGYTQSNTYYLERFCGWHGILVEAVPELYAKAARRRPRSHVAHCALVAPEHAGGTVTVSFGDLMSTVGSDGEHAGGGLRNAGRAAYTIEVPAKTLTEVLDEAGIDAVDLMVLDLEGHEFDALRGLDLDRHPVRHLVVEMLDMERQRTAFDALLADHFDFAQKLSFEDALYSWRR